MKTFKNILVMTTLGLALSLSKTSHAQWVSSTITGTQSYQGVDCMATIGYNIQKPHGSIAIEAFAYWTHADTFMGSVTNLSSDVGAITPLFSIGSENTSTQWTIFTKRFLMNAKSYIDSKRPPLTSRMYYKIGIRIHDYVDSVEFRMDSGGSYTTNEFSIGY